MEKDKHVIWNNDSLAHDGYEECIKEDWIQEVQAVLGLCESNDLLVPSGLVDAVKEAAVDGAIAKAMNNHEETINFVEAYREFANEENIGAIIEMFPLVMIFFSCSVCFSSLATSTRIVSGSP